VPLHPDYEAMLKTLAEMEGPALVDLPVGAGREMYRAMQPEAPELEVGAVRDIDAGGVPARLYRPDGDGPFPVVMMFHGGGWVIGDLTTADGQSREVCRGAGAVVVSVDYRLAPEHRFPAAADDCYTATVWAAANIAEHGGDASRVAVAGDSAGGNLAAVVAQMARDRGGPAIAFQLLVYPVTDGVNFNTASYHDNGQDYMLTTDSMHWFWNHYAPEIEERRNPYVSPLLADDLSDLPPALVMTAEFDPLRDEGEAYAAKLEAAGVAAELLRCDGLIHGFFGQTRTIGAARAPMDKACAALKSALALA
jgi:acetyl esterase